MKTIIPNGIVTIEGAAADKCTLRQRRRDTWVRGSETNANVSGTSSKMLIVLFRAPKTLHNTTSKKCVPDNGFPIDVEGLAYG